MATSTARFIRRLQDGEAVTWVFYGTSLSYHLAPHLRDALRPRYGDALQLINAGMPAKASRTALDELDARVLCHSPGAVTLEFAVNDAYSYEEFPDGTRDKGITLEESRANLQALIERLQQTLPSCEITLQTTNPAYDAPGQTSCASSRRPQLERFYDAVRAVASARALRLFDAAALWNELRQTDPARFQASVPDGVHPTPAALRGFLVPRFLEWLA